MDHNTSNRKQQMNQIIDAETVVHKTQIHNFGNY